LSGRGGASIKVAQLLNSSNSSDGFADRRVPGNNGFHVFTEDRIEFVVDGGVNSAELVVPGLVGAVHDELSASRLVHEE
jgi:hypothetical protein